MTIIINVVQELGYVALAVVQAGAYIFRFQCGLSCYLEMYKRDSGRLLEEYRNNVQKGDDYQGTVYTAWAISFKQLSAQAAKFLMLCAFLHHDGISEAIFHKAVMNVTDFVPSLPLTNEESDILGIVKD